MKKINLIKVIIIILISIILSSCNKEGNKKESKIEKKEKAPKSLVSVSEELDKILASMGEIKKITELTPLEFETLHSKGKGEEEGKKEGEKKKEEKLELRDEELLKKWNNIDKKIEKIHSEWNNYEVEAIKKAVNPEKAKEFKKNLNLCTIAIEDRNIKNILDTGSQAILSLASFFDLYKDEIKGDLSRIKYAIYQAYLIEENNIENAKKILDSTGENITRLRQKLGKDKEKVNRLDKLSLAIEDMKQSLNEDNKKLLELKRDIVINNIKLLEK
ncbi:MAG: hypothetical protein GX981_01990 [Tissierellia bacterium]|nr:hypothetical protein [Tissierellia bacterium]